MKIFIWLVTAFAVYNILYLFGLFEYNTRPSKTLTEVKVKRKSNRAKKREKFILGLYSTSVELFRAIFLPDSLRIKHEYYIQRLELRAKHMGRLLTPEEVRGSRVFPLLVSLFVIPIALFYPLVLLIPILATINLFTYQTIYSAKINDEDEIIDNYFIDLYLLLYSILRQGSRARLKGTIENYINTLETTKETRESQVMLKFSKYFLNLLSFYEDHVAVPHLRDNYHSATIINFCNIATQSLNGVENFDNLITFRMQLTERRTNVMRERQKKILEKGNRSVLAIWLLLFIFIAVGWYSKLPKGAF